MDGDMELWLMAAGVQSDTSRNDCDIVWSRCLRKQLELYAYSVTSSERGAHMHMCCELHTG